LIDRTNVAMAAKWVWREIRKTSGTYSPEGGGRSTEVYELTYRDSMVIASSYDYEIRAHFIDHW
jgi:hypothetical protein